MSYRFPQFIVFVALFHSFLSSTGQSNNYQYDELGRIVADWSEGVVSIKWNNANKIIQIVKADTCTTPDIEYAYNTAGLKTMQLLKPRDGNSLLPEYTWRYTYYTYDPSGNVMSVYERDYQQNSDVSFVEYFNQSEQNLYSGKRFGYHEFQEENAQITFQFAADVGNGGEFSNIQPQGLLIPAFSDTDDKYTKRGSKKYEQSNHIFNVITMLTDRRIRWDGIIEADVQLATDYYPFGMPLPNRNAGIASYRYGMNGQEKLAGLNSTGSHYIAPYWGYDSRLGRRWNEDPVVIPGISPYATFENNPIIYFDLLGDKITGDRYLYGQLKKDVQDRLNMEHAQIKSMESLKAYSEKFDQEYELTQAKARAKEWTQVLKEFDVLEKSSQNYRVGYTSDPSLRGKSGKGGGVTTLSDGGRTVDILVHTDVIKEGLEEIKNTLLHELAHGYQYETGEIAFYPSVLDPDEFIPIPDLFIGAIDGDEGVPYNRGLLYSTNRMLSNLRNPSKNLNDRFSDEYKFTYKQYFAYTNYLYATRKKEPVYHYIGWRDQYMRGIRGQSSLLSPEVQKEIEQYFKSRVLK